MASQSPVAQMAAKVKKYDSAAATEAANIKSIDDGRASGLHKFKASKKRNPEKTRRHKDELLERLEPFLGKTDPDSVRMVIKLCTQL